MNNRAIIFTGLLFSILSVIADHMILWHPTMNPLNNDFLFLGLMPRTQVIGGVWLGIFGVIGEVACLYLLLEKFSAKSLYRKMAYGILFLLVNLGVGYHLMLGYLQDLAYARADLTPTLTAYVRPLEAMIGVLFVLLNIVWFKLTREKSSTYNKALRGFLPAYVYVLGLILNFVLPSLGQMILLCGLNLAIGMIFVLAIPKSLKQAS